MTLQTLPSLIAYPGLQVTVSGNTLSSTIDASGEYAGVVFVAPKSGNIASFGWLPSTPATATLELRAEPVGTDGFPTGSLWATNTNLTGITPTANTWRWDTFTAAVAVTKGDLVAIFLKYASGTSSGVRQWNNIVSGFYINGLPYNIVNAGSPAKSTYAMVCAIKYDDGSVPPCGLLPVATTTNPTVTIDETSTPDEVGIKFTLPFACTVAGMAMKAVFAGRLFDVHLYDGSDNVLASLTGIDTDKSGNVHALGTYLFSAEVNLAPVTTYRLTMAPKSGAASVSVPKVTFDASSTRSAWPGGANAVWTQRTDGGAWTDTDTAISVLELLVSKLDDGASAGGGLLVNPGMSGGLL